MVGALGTPNLHRAMRRSFGRRLKDRRETLSNKLLMKQATLWTERKRWAQGLPSTREDRIQLRQKKPQKLFQARLGLLRTQTVPAGR